MTARKRKPTRTQLALIAYFDGGLVPAGRVSQPTYDVCVREGWIVPIERFPFHKATDAGREVLAEAGR